MLKYKCMEKYLFKENSIKKKIIIALDVVVLILCIGLIGCSIASFIYSEIFLGIFSLVLGLIGLGYGLRFIQIDYKKLWNKNQTTESTITNKKSVKFLKAFNIVFVSFMFLLNLLLEFLKVWFLIVVFLIGVFDGLFVHKIRLQEIRKHAAQKAAETRKRNAPYR